MYNPFKRPKLSEEQLAEMERINSAIAGLKQSEGWHELTKAVEAKIKLKTPKISAIMSTDEALDVATQVVYISGMRDVLDLVDQAEKRLAQTRELQAKNK